MVQRIDTAMLTLAVTGTTIIEAAMPVLSG
jgi:hypothetical protein